MRLRVFDPKAIGLPYADVRMLLDVLRTRPLTESADYYSALLGGIKARDIVFNARLNKDVIVAFRGLKFLINSQVNLGACIFLKYFEPRIYAILCNSTGDVFVDIGANVGGYSVRLALNYDKVISVEPNPFTADILRRNVKLNNLDNVQIIEKAVSDHGPRSRLFAAPKLINWSLTQASDSFVDVPTVTLDELVSPYKQVDFVKIDTEGSELDVITSGVNALEKIQRLIIEVRAKHQVEILRLLRSVGFVMVNLDPWNETENNFFCDKESAQT
jgi:FkbM family methyltransferase